MCSVAGGRTPRRRQTLTIFPPSVFAAASAKKISGFSHSPVFNLSVKDSDSDELSAKLRAWRVSPQVPASFHREVWSRIAARQSERDQAVWSRGIEWLVSALLRPRYAVALVVMSTSLSLAAAHIQSQETQAKNWKTLEARYAASINPLAMGR
jgi:hypothetical protein